MRVALLHPSYWPEVRRGAERLVHDVAAGLAGRGHEVTVLTSHRAGRTVSREEGFTVVRAYRPPTRPLHRRSFELHLTNVPATVSGLVRGGFDVAHAFFHVDAWAALAAQWAGGPPLVWSMLGIPDRWYLVAARWRMALLRRVVEGAAVATVLSEAAARAFERYLLRRPEVLPGGVDCRAFAPGERDGQPTLICAASLNDPRKRGELLVRAFAALREREPQARLLLAGRDDPTQGGAALELPEGATFVEAVDTSALARAYASASASVLPAVDEAFGLVLLESLAAGTPVVAARSGACPEVVADNSYGRLFQPDDEGDLVRAMEEALVLGRSAGTPAACRQRALEFDWPAILPRYEELYERARSP